MNENIIDINKLLNAINDRDENWVSWKKNPSYRIVTADERVSKGILDKLREAGRNGNN